MGNGGPGLVGAHTETDGPKVMCSTIHTHTQTLSHRQCAVTYILATSSCRALTHQPNPKDLVQTKSFCCLTSSVKSCTWPHCKSRPTTNLPTCSAPAADTFDSAACIWKNHWNKWKKKKTPLRLFVPQNKIRSWPYIAPQIIWACGKWSKWAKNTSGNTINQQNYRFTRSVIQMAADQVYTVSEGCTVKTLVVSHVLKVPPGCMLLVWCVRDPTNPSPHLTVLPCCVCPDLFHKTCCSVTQKLFYSLAMKNWNQIWSCR